MDVLLQDFERLKKANKELQVKVETQRSQVSSLESDKRSLTESFKQAENAISSARKDASAATTLAQQRQMEIETLRKDLAKRDEESRVLQEQLATVQGTLSKHTQEFTSSVALLSSVLLKKTLYYRQRAQMAVQAPAAFDQPCPEADALLPPAHRALLLQQQDGRKPEGGAAAAGEGSEAASALPAAALSLVPSLCETALSMAADAAEAHAALAFLRKACGQRWGHALAGRIFSVPPFLFCSPLELPSDVPSKGAPGLRAALRDRVDAACADFREALGQLLRPLADAAQGGAEAAADDTKVGAAALGRVQELVAGALEAMRQAAAGAEEGNVQALVDLLPPLQAPAPHTAADHSTAVVAAVADRNEDPMNVTTGQASDASGEVPAADEDVGHMDRSFVFETQAQAQVAVAMDTD